MKLVLGFLSSSDPALSNCFCVLRSRSSARISLPNRRDDVTLCTWGSLLLDATDFYGGVGHALGRIHRRGIGFKRPGGGDHVHHLAHHLDVGHRYVTISVGVRMRG